MRFKSFILGLVVVLAFGVPAFASAGINGQLATEVNVENNTETNQFDWDVYSKLNIDLDVELDKVSSGVAHIEFRGIDSAASKNGDTFTFIPRDIRVEQAYFGMNTNLWPNGPSGQLKIGQQIVALPLLGALTDHAGITFSNVAIDNFNTQFAYVWGNSGTAAEGEATLGLHAARRIEGTEFAVSLLQNSVGSNVGFEGAVNIFDDRVSLRAGRIADLNNNLKVFTKVGTRLSDDIELAYNVTKVDDGFAWLYPVRDIYDENEDGKTSDFVTEDVGRTSEVAVEFRNHQAVVSYEKVEGSSDDKTTIAAKKVVTLGGVPVVAKYEQERAGDVIKHTFGGEAVVNIGTVNGVGLAVELVRSDDNTTWDVEAGYELPSGLNLKVGYASDAGVRFGSAMTLSF